MAECYLCGDEDCCGVWTEESNAKEIAKLEEENQQLEKDNETLEADVLMWGKRCKELEKENKILEDQVDDARSEQYKTNEGK